MPRQIGFSTYCETFTGADYTAAEWEFVRAMAAYQKRWNRRYPSWREVLAVVEGLGYRKVGPAASSTSPLAGEVAASRSDGAGGGLLPTEDRDHPPPAESLRDSPTSPARGEAKTRTTCPPVADAG